MRPSPPPVPIRRRRPCNRTVTFREPSPAIDAGTPDLNRIDVDRRVTPVPSTPFHYYGQYFLAPRSLSNMNRSLRRIRAESRRKEQAARLQPSPRRKLWFKRRTEQEDSDLDDITNRRRLMFWKKKKKAHWSPPQREPSDFYMSPPAHVLTAIMTARKMRLRGEEPPLELRQVIDCHNRGTVYSNLKRERPPLKARVKRMLTLGSTKKKERGWQWAKSTFYVPLKSPDCTTSSQSQMHVDASNPPRRPNVEGILPQRSRYRKLIFDCPEIDSESASDDMDDGEVIANRPAAIQCSPRLPGNRSSMSPTWPLPESPPYGLTRASLEAQALVGSPGSARSVDARSVFSEASSYASALDYHTSLQNKPYTDRIVCKGTGFASPRGTMARQRAMELYLNPNFRATPAPSRSPASSAGVLERLTNLVPSVQDIAAVPCSAVTSALDKYYSYGTQPMEPPRRWW